MPEEPPAAKVKGKGLSRKKVKHEHIDADGKGEHESKHKSKKPAKTTKLFKAVKKDKVHHDGENESTVKNKKIKIKFDKVIYIYIIVRI